MPDVCLRRLLLVTATAFVVAFAYSAPAAQQQVPRSSANQRTTPGPTVLQQEAVLAKYCITCHNQRTKTGGLALDALDLSKVSGHAAEWEKVVRKVRTGAMPPVGRARPDRTSASNLVTWLETELDRAASERVNPGRASLQRLNRSEYANAVRDLLAVEIDAASVLPADVAGHGFDNNADALTLSAALTERYLGAAAKISQMALGRPRGLPTPETIFVATDSNQGLRANDDLPFGSRGGVAFRYFFPADGEYLFELKPRETGVSGGFEGVTEEAHDVHMSFDNVEVWKGRIGGPEFARGRGAAPAGGVPYGTDDRDKKVVEMLTFRVPVKAGLRLVQVYFAAKTSSYLEDLFDRSVHREPYRKGAGQPNLSTVTITGPQPATSTVSESPSRRKILTCSPRQSGGAAAAGSPASNDEGICARKIIATLARGAYRRPVTSEDLQPLMDSYAEGASRGGFESGIELAIRSILVSPDFLFRLEREPAGIAPNAAFRVNDIDLASRLSFFLWSSIPDAELLRAAEKNTLRQPDVLQQQVRRMLADPRAKALVNNFAGQWLHIRNVAGHQPSPEFLFHYDDNLRKAFEQETKLFFESIIRENRSVLDLLDADYTFLDERLAKHYGIPGVYGERFRRVALPADSPRRGLMGKGSILMSTSYPNRTSPVIRGKWILENILGSPPPPPPPNVPDLKDERDPRKVLPMREQLAAHRSNPVCAGCHAQMDQLGFSLENFDGIGEWRDVYASGARVDASAELPDGTKFNGPAELRQVLMKHSDEFLTTMTEKLLTYALGRGLEAYDAPAVRKIKRDAARDNLRFSSLVQGVVTSVPFQMKLAHSDTN
jgi:mono/diheme cytochrome c family protein